MIHASRRKILSLFAAAPAALPVAVKEAAERAGIGSAASMAPLADGGMQLPPPAWDAHIARLKDSLLNVTNGQRTHDRKCRALEQAHRLNPNLASLRSVSPAVAYRIEYERQVKLLEERDRLETNFQLVEALRQKALGNT